MKKLLIIFFTIPIFSAAQIPDTIYFNKNWELSKQSDSKYYRTYSDQDSLFQVTDYYSDGIIQWTGNTDKDSLLLLEGNIREYIGHCIYFDRKGRKEKMYVNNLITYYNFFQGVDSLNLYETINNELEYQVYYYKNGEIRTHGVLDSNCKAASDWRYYNKKGAIWMKRCYSNNQLTKKTIYWSGNNKVEKYYLKGKKVKKKVYDNGKLQKVVTFENGKRHKLR